MENAYPEEATKMLPITNGAKEKAEEASLEVKTKSWYGVRHTQMILLFFLTGLAFGMRGNFSVAIVAMTDPTINPDFPIYNWTMKSTILSPFFWGYVIPQIGAGQLAETIGAKWILAGGMGVSSLFTVLTPFMAGWGSWGIMVCRASQGLSQGFFFPCMHNLLSRWIPLSERARMGTFIYAGGPLGTVISMLVTGWICAGSLGWPGVFYLYGAVGFLWTLVWVQLGASDPSDHKRMSEEEISYIRGHSENKSKSTTTSPTPWKYMITSLPVWGILVAHCGHAFGFNALMTQTPRFMNSILHFDIKANGLLSAAPYLNLWILSFIFSSLTDLFINKNICSVGAARKIVTAVGSFVPGAALLFLATLDSSERGIIIALLIIAVGVKSATFSGFVVNHIDIAPSHAGTLMGLTNAAANSFSILAPLSVEFIVTDETNPEQWKMVFYLAAAVYLGCCLMFIIFGKGEVQHWDNLLTDDLEKEMTQVKNGEIIDKKQPN